METKECISCNKVKSLEEFCQSKSIYKSKKCKKCAAKYTREQRLRKPRSRDTRRNDALKRKYKMTLLDYNKLATEQDNLCLICKNKQTTILRGVEIGLVVDHNHITGKVRGLLCTNCNAGLGWFKENTEYLKEAINYLEKSR